MPYALLSVSDKTGLTEFAKELVGFGLTLVSTGGTALTLLAEGIPYLPIHEYTGLPEMLDGRVKTLHHKVHGGILYIRGNEKHVATVRAHGILPIDFVVVNFYPFEKTAQKPGATRAEVIENIDIGGPAMVRSGAKNHASVTVIVDPADYSEVLECMDGSEGKTTLELRERLAGKVFRATADYDNAIANFLAPPPPTVSAPVKILPKKETKRIIVPPPTRRSTHLSVP
ncbi:MAG: hypothetical protein Q7R64_02190 [bacterium]|nr:hypothetical protein [bacterium]